MMTWEEAIEALRYRRNIINNVDIDWCANEIAAIDVVLSALRSPTREQVERMRGEWQVCFEDWRKQIAGDQCSKCGFQHYGTSINHYHFCPACGAPMTDEALEMVMERLEALNENRD